MSGSDQTEFTLPSELPILPLRGVVVYPMMWLPLTVGQDVDPPGGRCAGGGAGKSHHRAGPSQEPEEEGEAGSGVEVGSAAIVHRMVKAPDGTVRLVVQWIERIRVEEYTQLEPYLVAAVKLLPNEIEHSMEIEAMSRNLVELFRRLIALVPQLPDELLTTAMNMDDPRGLAYLVASSIRMDIADAQDVLEMDSVKEKLLRLTSILTRELEVLELGQQDPDRGPGRDGEDAARVLPARAAQGDPERAGRGRRAGGRGRRSSRRRSPKPACPRRRSKEAKRELDRLRKMPTQAAEYSVIKTYLDWLVEPALADGHRGQPGYRPRPRQVLDEDHYDLEEIKDRILEYLAVRKLRQERAEAEAAASGRTNAAIGLHPPRARGRDPVLRRAARRGQDVAGPVDRPRDGAQVHPHVAGRRARRGRDPRPPPHLHRRHARPHRSRRCAASGSRNPVFMLDEVDKLGTRLPRRPVLGAAGSARPGAEPRVPRSLPGRALRPVAGDVHHHGQPAGARSRRRCATAWRSSSCSGYTEDEKVTSPRAIWCRASSGRTACASTR